MNSYLCQSPDSCFGRGNGQSLRHGSSRRHRDWDGATREKPALWGWSVMGSIIAALTNENSILIVLRDHIDIVILVLHVEGNILVHNVLGAVEVAIAAD